MTSGDEGMLRAYRKTYSKLVAKSWLDPTLRERLKNKPADALAELGVADLTDAELMAVAKFINDDTGKPQPSDLPPRDPTTGLRPPDAETPPRDPTSGVLPPDAGPASALKKPRLVSYVYVRAAPPDPSGTEALHFVSSRRQIKLEGHRLRLFHDTVLPLLDGHRTMEDIEAASRAQFRPDELGTSLGLLASHNLLEDADRDTLGEPARIRLAPQLNFFHELGVDAQEAQARLAQATVTVFGLGGAGAAACLALAGAHVGNLRCVDAARVLPSDPVMAPTFSADSVGRPRAQVVADMVKAVAPDVNVTACVDVLETDDAVLGAIEGSDFVVCCLDPGLASLVYKVNRACLRAGIGWTACSASAFEGVVGPTVVPFSTACWLCYQMREAACADRPDDALAHLEFLDARRTDDSGVREGNPFSAGAVGNLAALEAFKQLSGVVEPVTVGHIVVLDFLRLATARHLVLRKPDCPACSRPAQAAGAASHSSFNAEGGLRAEPSRAVES